ncbi:FAD linked oxidase domain protein [Natronorubrum sulfidifaciens JCM 14089]|uniref:FAD linked oxidase domain protein n=1 Tax=Natronorubrum sulfidifaciens JCM 14089 TaxID=1230460 RepID=L9W2K1_9EURY|nr:FAD-linked oxidase C-terminal domain-containing protein [Natronorubrum sulfidifaciens]ELY42538.1 FAD linked oxidase domain protein [Natronorubrum sulfidifaciens JCM 14089]
MSDDDAEMDALWQARRKLAYAVPATILSLEPLHPGDVIKRALDPTGTLNPGKIFPNGASRFVWAVRSRRKTSSPRAVTGSL